mgnify:CR=1 FL=1|tara:strand:+ start:6379 stop:6882 length:504 start_codon:yes stop_codon:yes gene_type:complete
MKKTGKTYTIGTTVYELLPPVFGVLRYVSFFCRDAGESLKTTEDLRIFLKDKAALFVAGLITPQGVHPQDRDLEAIARQIDWESGPELQSEVMDDFFGQPEATPENLLKAGRAMNMLAGMILPTQIAKTSPEPGEVQQKPSSDMSQNSPEEIPSNESKSSGVSATST